MARAEKHIAAVTIHDGQKMTRLERKRIGTWLRARAAWFEKHGDLCSARFTARLMGVGMSA